MSSLRFKGSTRAGYVFSLQSCRSFLSKLGQMQKIVIVGAGPAGLTAGLEAVRAGHDVTIIEKDPEYVGGISRTVERDGYRFDIGGHRFFSKNGAIMDWWAAALDEDFLSVRRSSRIYYGGKFFSYPLEGRDALGKLGLWTSAMCFFSYVKAALFPIRNETSFEDWVVNRFGRKLFNTFFKTYTEKVWGVPCSEISKDWAAQRIKGFSLWQAAMAALFPGRYKKGSVKTLIDHFKYPRLGPGQLWEKVAADIRSEGGRIVMGMEVAQLLRSGERVTGLVARDSHGVDQNFEGDAFLLTMPLRDTVASLKPSLSENCAMAAKSLQYRDFLTVALVVDVEDPFDDQWIYIHEPDTKVGRVQNYRNWSSAMTPEDGRTCLGFEYFCQAGDGLWQMSDSDLVELAKRECEKIGLARASQVVKGYVVRMPKAYPLYTPDYSEKIDAIREGLRALRNLHVMGRNGMHKYNNQDHSMLTAMIAVENLDQSSPARDPWKVNSDAEYIEEKRDHEFAAGRSVPVPKGQ